MPRWTIILLILIVATVFRFQDIGSIPLGLYPDEPIRIVSAIVGILTVIGLYLLTKQLLNWQIAALSSYLMAISFWHVNISRSGSYAIIAPMLLVWGIFFLWHGLSNNKLHDFAISGIFWGLGFYTYSRFSVMPLVLMLTLLTYWHSVKKDFGHEKYLHARNQIIRGLSLFLTIAILISLPIGYSFWKNPSDFVGHGYRVEILAKNIVQTLKIFNFAGDNNWQYNMPSQPLLLWPIGILFILGFLRSIIKLIKIKKRHGHFSTSQTLLLSWFFMGLAPVMFSNETTPYALASLIVSPVVFIWAGEGLWWIMDKLGDWYHARDVHEYRFQHKWLRESSFAALLTIIILLASFTVAEYDKYFNKWAKNVYVTPLEK